MPQRSPVKECLSDVRQAIGDRFRSLQGNESERIIYEQALDDTGRYLEIQNRKINKFEIEGKQNLRLNLLVISILVASGALLASQETGLENKLGVLQPFFNTSLFVGLISAALSATLSIWSTLSSKAWAGPSSEGIHRIINTDYSEIGFQEDLLQSHRFWIEENHRFNKQEAIIAGASSIFLFLEMIYFVTAIYWGFYPPVNSLMEYGVLTLIFLFVVWVTSLPYTRFWDPFRRFLGYLSQPIRDRVGRQD